MDGRDARSPRVPDRILSQTSNSSLTSSARLGNCVHQLQLCVYLGFSASEPDSFVLLLPIPVISRAAHLFEVLDSFQIGFYLFDGSGLYQFVWKRLNRFSRIL